MNGSTRSSFLPDASACSYHDWRTFRASMFGHRSALPPQSLLVSSTFGPNQPVASWVARMASIHFLASAMIRSSFSTYPRSPYPLSQYGISSHPLWPWPWGLVQALPSNLHHGLTSSSRPVSPLASSSSWCRSHPRGVTLPGGSLTSGLGASGARLDT